MATEVITFPSKEQRDKVFAEMRSLRLRLNDKENPLTKQERLEAQAVKFSSNEMVEPPSVDNTTEPPTESKAKYRSTWSIAYPTQEAGE